MSAMTKKNNSRQVLIRELVIEDAPYLEKYCNDSHISQYQRNSFPSPYTAEHAVNWLKHIKKHFNDTHFAIATEKETIGVIGFVIQPDVYCYSAEISFWVGYPFWGHGIAAWAIEYVVQFAFREKKIKRLFANVMEENTPSHKVLKKNGFQLDGIMRENIFKNGTFHNEYIYSCLADNLETADLAVK